MDALTASVEIALPRKQAFECFVREITLWWPKEYTWSKNKLVELSIDLIPNGLCSEIGPNGFRCDWGTVTAVDYGHGFSLKWQISANRNPEPDTAKASEVQILFKDAEYSNTNVMLTHHQFKNHGEESDNYQKAMASKQGWPYILSSFANYVRDRQ
ncbi:SRPBCC domain-containing protein [Parapedobacter deserti]|uniref:SRPBCC domain-containing protein n=1 Tax=Parapedobacter deserti TaxID=1912957 RepID=A0ABV7JIQ4_9SPHI